jgi:hypothetical protein
LSENDQEVLKDAIEEAVEEELFEKLTSTYNDSPPTPVVTEEKESVSRSDRENHTQWALGGNGRFSPVGSTSPALVSGIYEPFAIPGLWGLELLSIASDGIYTLPDMATEEVLSEVNRFWQSEEKYRQHNLLYKRGIILSGPPGGGKTVTVKLLMNELVKMGGVVVIAQNINLTVMCLKAIRRIEPKRNVIVVLEDIDEIINFNGESNVLSMLDGENNIDNILHLATTNYPERLGARIINRPSRFDRRVNIGMPGAEARRVYLQKATNNGLSGETLDKWVFDTQEMSIAHLRELVAAVYCLDQPYNGVISRLKEMSVPIKGDEGFRKNELGFKSKKAPGMYIAAGG